MPVVSLVVDLSGSAFDTVLSVHDAQCAARIALDHDAGTGFTSKLTMTNVGAGNYAIVIDGSAGGAGAYHLTVKGTVAPNTRCSTPLFTGGANALLQCPMGTTCTGTGSNQKCQ